MNFQIKCFQHPLWLDVSIHLCYPSWSCPNFCMGWSALEYRITILSYTSGDCV